MPKYNDLITREPFGYAHSQMQDLANNLKQAFQLEGLFSEVILEQRIALSPAAQLMLVVPIVEAHAMQSYWQEKGGQDAALNVDADAIRQSLRQLILEAKINPARADQVPDELKMEDEVGKEWSMRSTFSLIKSFARHFCNIPPFCGEEG